MIARVSFARGGANRLGKAAIDARIIQIALFVFIGHHKLGMGTEEHIPAFDRLPFVFT